MELSLVFAMLLLPTLDPPIEILNRITAEKILYAALVLFATWLLVRTSEKAVRSLSKQVPRARFFFKLLAPLLRFALWPIGAFALISIFSPSRDTLLAVLASIGIALGLGAQDLVKNIIGGLVILLDRPYQQGDRVRIGSAYGEVV